MYVAFGIEDTQRNCQVCPSCYLGPEVSGYSEVLLKRCAQSQKQIFAGKAKIAIPALWQ